MLRYWVLTPYLGDEAEGQRTVNPWGLVELPRRQVFVGVVSGVALALLVAAPLQFIQPWNWVLWAAGVAASVWVFTSRTRSLGVHQYRHMLDMAKAKSNVPIYAGGKADTRVDDVRMLQQSWREPALRQHAAADAAEQLDDVFGWDDPTPRRATGLRTAAHVDVSALRPLDLADVLT